MKYMMILLMLLTTAANAQAQPTSRLDTFTLTSEILKNTKIGVDPVREIRVWLPADYTQTNKAYPVLYYLHNIFWDNTRLFSENRAGEVFDRAFENVVGREFIIVAGDFTAPNGGTFFGNNDVSGRWFDHVVDELVPMIDARYRTLAKAESRGVAGDFLGGYAAIKMSMLKPGVFSSVYALHPVGTETGEKLMRTRPDWRAMNSAKSFAELSSFGVPFMLMAQAHTPNPDAPPFYADLMVELVDGQQRINDQHTRAMHQEFFLSSWVSTHADKLRQLEGLMFDWGRYDDNQDHVYANQKFTRELEEYGVAHQAEEYGGGAWDKNWIEQGRVEARLIPFFTRHFKFE